ncbi:Ig-like domain-containing protein [Sodalis ligni]|uniref:Ig-like protein group 2 n=1 Tax=Sodalis ligni TaxID=2697027 RepID=A0A4R1N9Y3_9GAMM|nr:Ig-like domain-containing protein [Sodalis ligni]TCL02341.1 Ig-like protein group 2 [Sodalis ligni]
MSYLITKLSNVTATYPGAVVIDGSLLSPIFMPIYVTSATLSPSSSSGIFGSTTQLTVNVLPANAADKTGVYSSSNTSVATVDQNGLVTRLSLAGTATITWTANDGSGITATSTIVSSATNPANPVTASYDSWDFAVDASSLIGKINSHALIPPTGMRAPTFGVNYIQVDPTGTQSQTGGLDSTVAMDVTNGQTVWAVFAAPEATIGGNVFGTNSGTGGLWLYKNIHKHRNQSCVRRFNRRSLYICTIFSRRYPIRPYFR